MPERHCCIVVFIDYRLALTHWLLSIAARLGIAAAGLVLLAITSTIPTIAKNTQQATDNYQTYIWCVHVKLCKASQFLEFSSKI